MKKLKCESCGGDIYITENKEFAVCPFCDTKYKLNDDKNIYIRLDEDTKRVISNGVKVASKGFGIAMIPFILVPFIIFVAIIFVGVTIYKNISNGEISDFDKSVFNNKFEMYSGTESAFSIRTLLDNVVTNNKKNEDKLITVVYEDISTTNPDEIVDIKHLLSLFSEYEVKLEYGDNGLVNKVVLEGL